MKTFLRLGLSLVALLALSGCDRFTLEFSEPAGQFEAASLPMKGEKYVRKKISVRGIVVRHDMTDSDNNMLYLSAGVVCNFGTNKMIERDFRVGSMAYVDGILRRCLPGDILIDPAVARDPEAEFIPTH